VRPGEELRTPRRDAGSRIEHSDQCFAAVEGCVQRREVADLERYRPETGKRSEGVEGGSCTRVWNEKAQRAQRRSRLLHGASQTAIARRPHKQSESHLEEGQPGNDLTDELDGRLDSKNPVRALIGADPVRNEAEHGAVDEEDHPGNAAPNAARYDQRAEDTPSRGQDDASADHTNHDSDGHVSAWHASKRRADVKVRSRTFDHSLQWFSGR
jgi:hypothetical protein